MSVEFVKMSGSGNDFIVVDNRRGVVEQPAEFARANCPRRTAVGADGLLLIEPSEKADFRMRIINADGSEPQMCGNGARCAARLACARQIAPSSMRMETMAGVVSAEVEDERVCIGLNDAGPVGEELALQAEGTAWKVHPIEAGVPHAIIFTNDLDAAPVVLVGRAVRHHETFQPRGTNVDFVEHAGGNQLRLRTYERGVEDETMACGTGAIASAVVACERGLLKAPPVRVETRGGELTIDFRMEAGRAVDVRLCGEAEFIYEGTLL